MNEMYSEDIYIDNTPREGFIISAIIDGHRVKKHYIDWDTPNATDDFIGEYEIEIIH